VGEQRARTYWKMFEQLRDELGYADYLGALHPSCYRNGYPHDLRILTISHFLVNYPFANGSFRTPSMQSSTLNDGSGGDSLRRRRGVSAAQVECSGLSEAVEGHVMIYVHKENDWRTLSDVTLQSITL